MNILLIGADRRAATDAYITDTLIVASIDPATSRVAMFGLPRDTVGVPFAAEAAAVRRFSGGLYPRKINSLYTFARANPGLFPGTDSQRGFRSLKGALGALYGIEVQYYVAVDFAGFLDVMDALGGVTVDVQVPVRDYHYPADDGRGSLNLYLAPGIQHLDGPTALAYARARHLTDDFDRGKRQQRLISSVARQTDVGDLLLPGRMNALFRAIRDTVRTDIPADLFSSVAALGQGMDLDRLKSVVFVPPRYSTVCFPCAPTGEYLVRANVPAIRRAVADALR